MLWATRILEFTLQPGQGVGRQGDGPLPRFIGRSSGWGIGRQQLHQRPRQLFGRPTGSLALQRMPIAIADGQAALQGFRQWQAFLGPAWAALPQTILQRRRLGWRLNALIRSLFH